MKKPKLDQHSGRCHGGFDCIDCSKSFNGPWEWKSHTSCISEAEKYQKSVYKGPKVRLPRSHGRLDTSLLKDRSCVICRPARGINNSSSNRAMVAGVDGGRTIMVEDVAGLHKGLLLDRR